MGNPRLNTSEQITALLVLEGKSTGEIADFLGVTRGHVNNMKKRLRTVMGHDDIRDAAKAAKKRGLLNI